MSREPYPHPRGHQPPLSESLPFVVIVVTCLILGLFWLVWTKAYHYTNRQVAEFLTYGIFALAIPVAVIALWATRRTRREKLRVYPPIHIDPNVDEKTVQQAWAGDSVVLGYNIHGEPWLWPDHVRVAQGIVLGMTGSGKTTLLKNIISQDLIRRVGPDRERIPMVIFDGKGDLEFFYDLLPYINEAGRMEDLRLINPARPDLSCRYNPFHCDDENYMAQVNMVFGSFDLHDEFFAKHQLNYLADIVRVLHYTGLAFNFYDVIVMAMDQEVLKQQIENARKRIRGDQSISQQRRLNFEMSVRNLIQSLEDRERVPKIQGLLNECMTFLDDELSVITGPYEELLSLDEVIDRRLVLFVSLNVNKNTQPVRALGKMLLQNLQLVVGKRYESEAERKRTNKPLLSVVLDEFAPFGYQNFAQILQTARGTNTAFLFSMQSLPQLLRVGRGFKDDVTSAPATKILLRTHDEETARYFIRASAEHRVTRRTVSVVREQFLGFERFERGSSGSEREDREYRAEDETVKNLPKGQMEILMSDDTAGTLYRRLYVRTPPPVAAGFDMRLAPRLQPSRADVKGAELRFKSPELAAMVGRRMAGRRFPHAM